MISTRFYTTVKGINTISFVLYLSRKQTLLYKNYNWVEDKLNIGEREGWRGANVAAPFIAEVNNPCFYPPRQPPFPTWVVYIKVYTWCYANLSRPDQTMSQQIRMVWFCFVFPSYKQAQEHCWQDR